MYIKEYDYSEIFDMMDDIDYNKKYVEIVDILLDIDKGKYKAIKSLDSHLPQKHIDDFLDKKYD